MWSLAAVVVSLLTLVCCSLLSSIRGDFIDTCHQTIYVKEELKKKNMSKKKKKKQQQQKQQQKKKRRAQPNAFFKDPNRWLLEHKGTNVMDNATSQALLSQGTLESEITYEGEDGLIKSFIYCNKFKKHDQFIAATAFTIEHLPGQFQNKDVHDCIKRLMTLCGCIRVQCTSKNRPKGCPFSQVDARKHERYGSGSFFLPKEEEGTKGKFCPCRGGRDSVNPCKRTEWYSVLVSTALHVVYDDLEASQTRVGWQYNEDANKDSIPWLQGVRLVNTDMENDRCILECVTHDFGIYDCIRKSMLFLRQKERELNERYFQYVSDNGQPLLAVIVSHPHGFAKQVSLGTKVVRHYIKDNRPGVEWTRYWYDAPTCRGSSGALVWLPGQMRLGIQDKTITVHTHSGKSDETFNMSGGGLNFVCTSNNR